jgi:hypothetical protein
MLSLRMEKAELKGLMAVEEEELAVEGSSDGDGGFGRAMGAF